MARPAKSPKRHAKPAKPPAAARRTRRARASKPPKRRRAKPARPAKAARTRARPKPRKAGRRTEAGQARATLPLSAPMRMLIETARRKRAAFGHETLALHHWVVALRELFPILPRDIPWDEMRIFDIKSALREGNAGRPFAEEAAMAAAARFAEESGSQAPTIDDLALAILDRSGLASAPEAPPAAVEDGEPEVPAPAAPAAPLCADVPEAEGTSSTPMLDRFGRNLTREARAGLLPPVIDRQQEVALVIETLCRRKKKNVSLIGPAGVGKRAIVEAVAHRIARGTVPAGIAGLTVIELQLPALLAGVTTLGELDERFGEILREVRDSGAVLFLDELRAITAAGHDGLTLMVSNKLKPEIARGLTVIVSGAEDDRLRLVELDPSIRAWSEQWFQPIRVDELSPEATLEALNIVAAHTQSTIGVSTPPQVLKWIVSFAADLLRGHPFPGKAIDLLEQCVAHAVSKGANKVTLADARETAERIIAIPVDIESRLRRITKLLGESDLLAADDQQAIVERLSVTMRSLDLIPARPNFVLLLAGEAAVAGRPLSETLADAIGGSTDRVIAIDFGLLTEAWDTRQLLGIAGPDSPPLAELPLHRLVGEPWSVVLADNVDGCHPQVRASLTRALSEGYFIDAKGKKLYMSEAVVVMTAPSIASAPAPQLGFGRPTADDGDDGRAIVSKALDAELVEQVDSVVRRLNRGVDLVQLARQQSLLADLTKRYRSRGLEITWDKSLVEWFRSEPQQRRSRREWQQWADKNLASVLIPHLPVSRAGPLKRVVVKREGDHLSVGQARAGGPSEDA